MIHLRIINTLPRKSRGKKACRKNAAKRKRGYHSSPLTRFRSPHEYSTIRDATFSLNYVTLRITKSTLIKRLLCQYWSNAGNPGFSPSLCLFVCVALYDTFAAEFPLSISSPTRVIALLAINKQSACLHCGNQIRRIIGDIFRPDRIAIPRSGCIADVSRTYDIIHSVLLAASRATTLRYTVFRRFASCTRSSR